MSSEIERFARSFSKLLEASRSYPLIVSSEIESHAILGGRRGLIDPLIVSSEIESHRFDVAALAYNGP